MKRKREIKWNYWIMPLAIALMSSTLVHADEGDHDPVLGLARCGSLGDSLAIDQGVGRRTWAEKYYSANPQWLTYYKAGKRYVDPRTNQRVQLYPTYGVFTGGVDGQGLPNISNPRHYQGGIAERDPANLPSDYELIAMCVPSCFAPGTQLATSEYNTENVETLSDRDAQYVLTPTPGTSMAKLGSPGSYHLSAVGRFISDIANVTDPIPQAIVDIKFRSGGSLSITPEHSVLMPTGTMKPAKQVVEGDLFVKADGSLDEVVSVAESKKLVRVYNLTMKSQEPLNNLVVSNGYLTGTYYFQEKQAEFINRQIFRDHLPDSLVNSI